MSTPFAENVTAVVCDIESRMFAPTQEPNEMLNQVAGFDIL